ncbi:MAG: biopolymer transporter ExbD [Candidatus Omnitrophica bacterium]|nr:biopolymer transporter ExbD [Candidatus Omnitrophota bacterium]
MRFLKQKIEEPGFQMAPMIDCVFLLLIFFMSVSTFHQLESVEGINLPVADQSRAVEDATPKLSINIKSDGAIVMNQNIYEPEQLAKVLSGTGIKQTIVIRADKTVPHGRVLDVLSACAAAGIWDISFATFQEEPKK